ncbi:hypothetical protein IV38_GL001543 [Lactobacillus selangorensis]|uniref:Uncharacterized protein n=1 Tax=Lactobacillus selangorensis TaxID=81857 RepID=A0A0R2FTG8_9LACO|nr:hypothetical protein IV38_GL001543 [Lactobacillus selangorensis]
MSFTLILLVQPHFEHRIKTIFVVPDGEHERQIAEKVNPPVMELLFATLMLIPLFLPTMWFANTSWLNILVQIILFTAGILFASNIYYYCLWKK